MKHLNTLFLVFLVGILQLISCGGSSEQGNARYNSVSGKVLMCGQTKTAHMELVPDYFDALDNDSAEVYRTESDNSGNYEFKSVKKGCYYLNAVNPRDGHRLLRGPIFVEMEEDEIKDLGSDSLVAPSRITADVGDIVSNKPVGIFVKGTTRIIHFDDTTKIVQIDSVPAGTIDLMYVSKDSSQAKHDVQPFLNQLKVCSEDTLSVSYDNQPPYLISNSKPYTNDSLFVSGDMYFDTIRAIDPEGDAVTYRIISAPSGLKLDFVTGAISWYVGTDTISKFRLGFRIEDEHGAGISVWRTINISQQSHPPKPSKPYCDTVGFINSFISVYCDTVFCSSKLVLYRFSWGDGDTSGWADSTSSIHQWTREGTFEVKVQIKCPDYQEPSLWSDPILVVVKHKLEINDLEPVVEPRSVYQGDTLQISFDSIACWSPFYKFYWNDSCFSNWTPNRFIKFTPSESGIYQVKVAAACDTSPSLISFSKPCSVTVKSLMPCLVFPIGDSTYAWSETLAVYINLEKGSCVGSDSMNYRFNIEKVDSVVTFRDTTGWSIEPSTVFYSLDSASTYKIQAQSRDIINNEIKESEWSPWLFIRIK